MTTLTTSVPSASRRSRMRSWVIGRGVSIPCKAKAIAVASGAPMKMGRVRPSPSDSWSRSTGVFDWRSTRTARSRTSTMFCNLLGGGRGIGRRRVSCRTWSKFGFGRCGWTSNRTPVLLLQESDGLGRTLPIFIGAPEATAIAFALQGMDTPRPMTHDLIRDLLDALGTDVVRVVITELRSSTYHAEIVLRHNSHEISVSSRPSDAVAVAVRTGTPLFAVSY